MKFCANFNKMSILVTSFQFLEDLMWSVQKPWDLIPRPFVARITFFIFLEGFQNRFEALGNVVRAICNNIRKKKEIMRVT